MASHYFVAILGFVFIGSVCCSDSIIFPDQIVSNVNTETGAKFNGDDSNRFHKTNKFGRNTYDASIHASNSWLNEKPTGQGHHQQPNGGSNNRPQDSWSRPGTSGRIKPGFPELPGFPEFSPSGNSQSNANAQSNSQVSNGHASSNSKASAQSQGHGYHEPAYYPSNGHPNRGFPDFHQSGGSQANANAQSNSQASKGHATSNSQANAQSQGPRHYGPSYHPSNSHPHRGFPNYFPSGSSQANSQGSSQASDGFSSSNSNSNSQTLGFGGGAASASSAASATTGIVNGRPVAAAAASAAAASAGGAGSAGTSSVSSASASSSGNFDKSPWFYRSRSITDDMNETAVADNKDEIVFLN
ncbi:homeobox protein B-H1 [Diachasma alloeum]|uniref:homeobox protein B-H1 n=1 Tax=Diachasma alloeum TaxID=454923 RepID=UPI0007383529|nr:homeobox protein B-H1 [Diachasma alloeum]